jgi:hypothetical protein
LNLCHACQLIIHLVIDIFDLTPDVHRQPRLLTSGAWSAVGSSDCDRATRGSMFHGVIIAVGFTSALCRTKHAQHDGSTARSFI